MKKQPKGLRAQVFTAGPRSPEFHAFATKKYVTLVGVGVDGNHIDPIFEADEDAPAATIVVREFGDREPYVFVEPFYQPEGKTQQRPMFGGAFVFGSDSRVRQALGMDAAAKLHDRYEH